MKNDDRLKELLREALPPIAGGGEPRDVWPALEERLDARPRWSLVDAGLGLAAAVALLIFPEWLLPLMYHL